MSIKIVPNFFQLAFDGENVDLISLDDSAYVSFASDADSSGLGIFVEINSDYIEFPPIHAPAYALTLKNTVDSLTVKITQDHVNSLEQQLNQAVLKYNPEFEAKLNQLLTLFNGVVSNTTQLFTQHPIFVNNMISKHTNSVQQLKGH